MCCGKVFLCFFGAISHPSANCKSSFKVMPVGLDDSPDFRGHLLFLMAPVHLACPGMQKEKEKKSEKIYGRRLEEKRLECHLLSISISLLDTVLRLSSVCVRQPGE